MLVDTTSMGTALQIYHVPYREFGQESVLTQLNVGIWYIIEQRSDIMKDHAKGFMWMTCKMDIKEWIRRKESNQETIIKHIGEANRHLPIRLSRKNGLDKEKEDVGGLVTEF